MRKLAIIMIRSYQLAISPFLGNNCRFQPTCSCYAHESIDRFGILKGSYLSIVRIFKCHPFHPGGYDPVMDTIENKNPPKQKSTEL